MIRSIIRRIIWIVYRRNLYRIKLKGFSASPLSFAYNNCEFSEYNKISGKATLFNTKLGRFSYVYNAHVSNTVIGAFSSIGPDVKIGGFGRHPMKWITTHPSFYSTKPPVKLAFVDKEYFEEFLPVTIGSDVWIGERAMILDGLNVGNGAVIGAGSIVTKDVLPYEVVAGVPAKRIRFRFSEEEIEMLEKNTWWTKDIGFLIKNSSKFRSNNVQELMRVL